MTEDRGLRGVARHTGDVTREDALDDRAQFRKIHRLGQAVLDGLLHQRVVGDFPVAGDVLETGGRIRKRRGHEIVRFHPLERRRSPPAGPLTQYGERNRGVPPPPGRKHRRIQQRLDQRVAKRGGVEIAEHVIQREGMLRPQRQEHAFLGGRGLQLEVERATKLLPQRQSPRPIHSAAEWRVQHQLHAAGFIEESLEHEGVLGREKAEQSLGICQVVNDLMGRRPRDADTVHEPPDGRVRIVEARLDVGAQPSDSPGQFGAPGRRLPEPERNVGWLALGVRHPHDAGAYLEDAPGRVPQLEDVARHALDGEVFVEGPDEGVFRLQDHPIVGVVGYGTARRDR